MMSPTDKLQYTCLMMLCWTLNSIHGENKGLFPSCEAELKVPRGTTWKTAPQQPLTVQCPVKHCGEALTVAWCKLSSHQCEPVTDTEAVEITQTYTGHLLISNLTFKVISISDDGLYRCYLKGSKRDISHSINISVSDMNQGPEYYHSQPYAAQRLKPPAGDVSWLPYFMICFSVAFLAAAMALLTHLSFRDRRRTLNCSPSHVEVTSRCALPGLPRADPSSPVLQARFPVPNDTYRPRASGTRPTAPPAPPPAPSGIQHQANAADEREAPDCAVYAVINHKQRGSAGRRPRTQPGQTEYSTVSGACLIVGEVFRP